MFVPAAQVAAACHEVVALVDQEGQELRNQGEVVGVIGIAHDQVCPARGSESGEIRVPIPTERLVDNACAQTLGDGNRPVRGAIVTHDNLPGNLGSGKRALDRLNTRTDPLLLVEAGQDHGHEGGRLQHPWRSRWARRLAQRRLQHHR
jgi:hypothetical protein